MIWLIIVVFIVMLIVTLNINSLYIPLQSQLSGQTEYIPKTLGKIWYVSKSGNDGNTGRASEHAFLTIGKAFLLCGVGDMIRVGAGTYTEVGLDLDTNSVTLFFEPGVLLDPASGTVLTVSGHLCVVLCPSSSIRMSTAANETGMLISGNFCYIWDMRVPAASTGDLGFDITGDGCCFFNCRVANPLIASFKIQGDKCKLERCCTGGTPVDTSIGFWFTNSCDKARAFQCGSHGHASGSFVVDSGCTNGVIEQCYSGKGDGRWSDADDAFTWPDWHWEDVAHKDQTLTAAGGVGGAGTNYNLFKITGSVKVFNIQGVITTATANDGASAVNLELYSTNASIDITDAVGAPRIDNRVVGTTFARESVATDPLEVGEPVTTPAVIENTSFRDPRVPIICVKDDSADTYVQMVLGNNTDGGVIHWTVQWEPVSDNGFLEAA